jgi:NNP family nitrate/nitrite transporter-like MFS transporter
MLLILTMAMLGMGNGSVFQLVPQRFPTQVGIITGIVGAAGGLGGFFLPSMLGAIKDRTGAFGLGFAIFGTVVLMGSAALLYLGRIWRRTWSADSAMRAGLLAPAQVELAGD